MIAASIYRSDLLMLRNVNSCRKFKIGTVLFAHSTRSHQVVQFSISDFLALSHINDELHQLFISSKVCNSIYNLKQLLKTLN